VDPFLALHMIIIKNCHVQFVLSDINEMSAILQSLVRNGLPTQTQTCTLCLMNCTCFCKLLLCISTISTGSSDIDLIGCLLNEVEK